MRCPSNLNPFPSILTRGWRARSGEQSNDDGGIVSVGGSTRGGRSRRQWWWSEQWVDIGWVDEWMVEL